MTRPRERAGYTQEIRIGDFKGWLTVSIVEGRPIEIFMTSAKQGTLVRGMMDSIASLISHLLQSDPDSLYDICDALMGRTYEPLGLTNDPETPEVKSFSDYLAHHLGRRFLPEADYRKLCEAHSG